MNKKGKKLMDDVEDLWRQTKDKSTVIDMNLGDFKNSAKGLLEQITGESTGEAPRDTVEYQKRKMKGFMEKRGMFGGNTTATPEQIALKKKRDAKARAVEAKRVEKRQRGSKTLKQRKIIVADIESGRMVAKYQDGYKVLYKYFCEMKGYDNDLRIKRVEKKLQKLGLIK